MERVDGQARADAADSTDTGATTIPYSSYSPVSATSSAPVSAASRRRGLAFDLVALGVVGALLIAALTAGGVTVYDKLYSPAAFVTRYLDLLGQGRAADALALPGVSVDSAGSDLPAEAGEALLRREALAPLRDIRVVGVEEQGPLTLVTMAYSAGPHRGATTFQVESNGRIGIAPAWRFAQSPLALVDLTVEGSRQFEVNGFELDTRQVSAEGVELDPRASVPLLVFAPGLYSVSVDTPVATSTGVAVLADTPQARTAVSVLAQPTEEFIEVVEKHVGDFLSSCATQQVLQPTGCPFGFVVHNRIMDEPTWSIVSQPTIELEPDGADWAIPRTEAVAHIQVDIRSLFDGSVRHVDEDVPFAFTGTIEIQPDGAAAIEIAAAD
ncbi:hypothetical protein [Microbacterium sp.]|uniref:hypothetical protein n=1 Tax=Microbacterium sp. TaxID=51671 RepID=UPI003221660C